MAGAGHKGSAFELPVQRVPWSNWRPIARKECEAGVRVGNPHSVQGAVAVGTVLGVRVAVWVVGVKGGLVGDGGPSDDVADASGEGPANGKGKAMVPGVP